MASVPKNMRLPVSQNGDTFETSPTSSFLETLSVELLLPRVLLNKQHIKLFNITSETPQRRGGKVPVLATDIPPSVPVSYTHLTLPTKA